MMESRFNTAIFRLKSLANSQDEGRARLVMLECFEQLIQGAVQLEHEHEQLKKNFETYRDEASGKINELQDKLGIESKTL